MSRLSDWMRTPLKVEDDEFDVVSAQQDVNDPVWPSSPVEPDVQQVNVPPPTHPDPEGRGEVRLLDGVLDFMEDVAEEVFHLAPEKPKSPPRDQPVLDVQERAATSWRATSSNIASNGAAGVQIVVERNDRTRVVVTNWGPGIAYLSHMQGASITGTNVIQIPVNGSREFKHADAIYAYPAVPGTAQIVDVQDEYGAPEWAPGGKR